MQSNPQSWLHGLGRRGPGKAPSSLVPDQGTEFPDCNRKIGLALDEFKMFIGMVKRPGFGTVLGGFEFNNCVVT